MKIMQDKIKTSHIARFIVSPFDESYSNEPLSIDEITSCEQNIDDSHSWLKDQDKTDGYYCKCCLAKIFIA